MSVVLPHKHSQAVLRHKVLGLQLAVVFASNVLTIKVLRTPLQHSDGSWAPHSAGIVRCGSRSDKHALV